MFNLIIVFALGSTGVTQVKAEFTSFEACEKARTHIVEGIKNYRYYSDVISQGCYRK